LTEDSVIKESLITAAVGKDIQVLEEIEKQAKGKGSETK